MTPLTTSELTEQINRRKLAAPSATVWGVIRHELLYVGLGMMEVALLTPVVLVIMGWARYWSPSLVAVWLLLMMLLPFNIIRVMGLLGISLTRQRRILLFTLLLTVFLSWHLLLYSGTTLFNFDWLRQFGSSLGGGGNLLWMRDLSVFLVTAFCWWRGVRLAVGYPGINSAGLRLRVGGLVLFPLVIWFGASFLNTNLVSFILLFFFSALIVISLVRAEEIERDRSGTAATLNVRWFLGVAGAAIFIVILGAILTTLVSGESIFILLDWLSPLWKALQFGVTATGIIVFETIYPIIELLARFVQLLATWFGGIFGQLATTLGDITLFSEINTPELPTPTETPGLLDPVMTGKAITAAIMLGLLALIALALVRTYQKASFATRESEASRAIRDADAGHELAQRLLGRFGLFRQWRAAASVRRIYRQMCRAARSAGYPRLGMETPYEYLNSLERVWPSHTTEVRVITEAFVRVRYGEAPETEQELEVLHSAWRRLETATMNQQDQRVDIGPTITRRE